MITYCDAAVSSASDCPSYGRLKTWSGKLMAFGWAFNSVVGTIFFANPAGDLVSGCLSCQVLLAAVNIKFAFTMVNYVSVCIDCTIAMYLFLFS